MEEGGRYSSSWLERGMTLCSCSISIIVRISSLAVMSMTGFLSLSAFVSL